jgi:hypothetical protein
MAAAPQRAAEPGAANEEAQQPTPITAPDEEEEPECPICKFVEAGPCKVEHQVRSL